MDKQPWAERKFRFETPVTLFPGLLERLRGTPARLEERVRRLPAALLTRRDGDAWSIQENAGHLLAAEALWHGRLDDYDAGLATLRPADMSNRRTREANYNEQALDEILAGFRASRLQLVARLESLDARGAERSAHHPRLDQPMRVIDLVVFVAEHDDHHLARITELLRGLSAR